jgi:hypothetical protein
MEDTSRQGLRHRVQSAAGWGLFLGICDYVVAWSVTNDITGWGVRAVVITETVLGAVIGLEKWSAAWWVKGLAFGLGFNVPLAAGLALWGGGWGRSLAPVIPVTGAAIGLFTEWIMRNRKP